MSVSWRFAFRQQQSAFMHTCTLQRNSSMVVWSAHGKTFSARPTSRQCQRRRLCRPTQLVLFRAGCNLRQKPQCHISFITAVCSILLTWSSSIRNNRPMSCWITGTPVRDNAGGNDIDATQHDAWTWRMNMTHDDDDDDDDDDAWCMMHDAWWWWWSSSSSSSPELECISWFSVCFCQVGMPEPLPAQNLQPQVRADLITLQTANNGV